MFGRIMFLSFIWNIPVIDHKKQLSTVAIVKGRGMLSADFVSRTFFTDASGLANSAMQKRTAIFPIRVVERCTGANVMRNRVAVITERHAVACWLTDPGNEGDELDGANWTKRQK